MRKHAWYTWISMMIFTAIFASACGNREQSEHTRNSGNEVLVLPSDGWSILHEIPVPDHGRVEISFDEITLAAEIRCTNMKETPYDPLLDELPGDQFIFRFKGSGTLKTGENFNITGSRMITHSGEGGRVRLEIEIPEGRWQISQADAETTPMPVLHVGKKGEFTLKGNFLPLHPDIHDKAITGQATLAGRCQQGWPFDQLN